MTMFTLTFQSSDYPTHIQFRNNQFLTFQKAHNPTHLVSESATNYETHFKASFN